MGLSISKYTIIDSVSMYFSKIKIIDIGYLISKGIPEITQNLYGLNF